MSLIFATLLVVHGLIHLVGFVKAFGLAELPQLAHPIPPLPGLLWLVATLLYLLTAVALFVWPRWWWALGACAIAVSTIVIIPSWSDARYGALADLIVLAGVVFGFMTVGPISLRAEYDREVVGRLAAGSPADLVTDADLQHLPNPVQRYLRVAGVVGRPRVHNFYARMHGRIRNGPGTPWISLTAEQYNFVDTRARLFYLNGSMFQIPVQGYHRYIGPSATMRVKAAGLVRVAGASGSEMDQGETVTMFNDMCVMAPATLIDPAIVWDPVDARTVKARFTNAGHTIDAELTFNDAGELLDFQSSDRYQASADGKSLKQVRWSTPIAGYRFFGSLRLAAGGEARWHEADGDYSYIELTFDDIRYNVSSREPS